VELLATEKAFSLEEIRMMIALMDLEEAILIMI
jgi:hypothetical protein